MQVLNTDGEGKAVLTEGIEVEWELVTRLSNRNQITSKLKVLWFSFQHLNITGLGHLLEGRDNSTARFKFD